MSFDVADRDPRVQAHRASFGQANGFDAPESFHRPRPQYDWGSGAYVDPFDPPVMALTHWPDVDPQWPGDIQVGRGGGGGHGGGGHGGGHFGGRGFGGGGGWYGGWGWPWSYYYADPWAWWWNYMPPPPPPGFGWP
jgi:hypothetical protein